MGEQVNNGGRHSLRSLLEMYRVVIPQLQRDYAQGRKEERGLRETFVLQLFDVLASTEYKHLNLDFVYGYTRRGEDTREDYYPLDGQQRLTTLWLLHCYLVPREELVEAKVWLGQFRYKTRATAERFCTLLLEEIEHWQTASKVREAVENLPRFRRSWASEPTVISMLVMLETIEKFCTERGYGIDEKRVMWARLTNGTSSAITFDSINMGQMSFG